MPKPKVKFKTISILFNPIIEKQKLYSLILWLYEQSREVNCNSTKHTIVAKGWLSLKQINSLLKILKFNNEDFLIVEDKINQANIKHYNNELSEKINNKYIKRKKEINYD